MSDHLSNVPNHFLASLSVQDAELLKPHLSTKPLPHAAVLHEQTGAISRVYFPTAGLVSLVVVMSNGEAVEAAVVGRNGVVGGSSALDGSIALNRAIVQAPGSASSIAAAALKQLAGQSESLRAALFQHEQVITAHMQQIAACNAVHHLEERLCRWFLQVRDLLQTDALPLTQEFMANMLGVRRTSLTMVARSLQAAGLIKYRRGRVEVVDVEGLHEAACECYEAINGYYEQLIGWRPAVAEQSRPARIARSG